MEFDIMEITKYLIVIFALLMAYAEIRQAVRLKGTGYAWIKWCLGFAGIFWAGYYIQSILQSLFDFGLPAHQIYVRGGILFTVAFVAAGALISLRRGKQ